MPRYQPAFSFCVPNRLVTNTLYKNLSNNAKILLIYLYSLRDTNKNIYNPKDARFAFSDKQFNDDFGLSRTSLWRARSELEKFGFIKFKPCRAKYSNGKKSNRFYLYKIIFKDKHDIEEHNRRIAEKFTGKIVLPKGIAIEDDSVRCGRVVTYDEAMEMMDAESEK